MDRPKAGITLVWLVLVAGLVQSCTYPGRWWSGFAQGWDCAWREPGDECPGEAREDVAPSEAGEP